jgi:hypothetical protein
VLCQKAGVPVFGIVENYSGFTCPHEDCGAKVEIMQTGGGQRLADLLGVPFLGKIPMAKLVAESADQGTPFVHKYPDWEGSKMLHEVAGDIDERLMGG